MGERPDGSWAFDGMVERVFGLQRKGRIRI